MSVSVEVRLFAAARSALGRREATVDASTIDGALETLLGDAADPDARAVLARCSFLVNRVATTDPAHPLADGDRLDVLPPFAGG